MMLEISQDEKTFLRLIYVDGCEILFRYTYASIVLHNTGKTLSGLSSRFEDLADCPYFGCTDAAPEMVLDFFNDVNPTFKLT